MLITKRVIEKACTNCGAQPPVGKIGVYMGCHLPRIVNRIVNSCWHPKGTFLVWDEREES